MAHGWGEACRKGSNGVGAVGWGDGYVGSRRSLVWGVLDRKVGSLPDHEVWLVGLGQWITGVTGLSLGIFKSAYWDLNLSLLCPQCH